MARIAVDWLVFELTGNVALVGLTVALQLGPTLLLGPWGGVISDRFPRRRVLTICQSVTTIVNGTLAVLVLTGWVQLWQVFVSAIITGAFGAIDAPSRSAFIGEMVGTEGLRSAISLNGAIFHLGGLVGPAISGILIVVVGSGWSIAINATTTAFAALALVFMRSGELVPAAKAPARGGQIREAVRYILRKPSISWVLLLIVFNAVFGMSLPVLLTASSVTYGSGAAGYGLYSSVAASGALAGAVLSSLRQTVRLRGTVGLVIVYGLMTVLAGVAPVFPVFLLGLAGLGVARVLFGAAAESITQLSSNQEIRGRVMSFYSMLMVGGQAIGGLVMGWFAEHLGSTIAFVIAGAPPAIAGATVAVILAHRRQLRLEFSVRDRHRWVQIVPREKNLRGTAENRMERVAGPD